MNNASKAAAVAAHTNPATHILTFAAPVPAVLPPIHAWYSPIHAWYSPCMQCL